MLHYTHIDKASLRVRDTKKIKVKFKYIEKRFENKNKEY